MLVECLNLTLQELGTVVQALLSIHEVLLRFSPEVIAIVTELVQVFKFFNQVINRIRKVPLLIRTYLQKNRNRLCTFLLVPDGK